MKNNKGAGSGLTLIAILIVALIIAYLVATQMGAFGLGKKDDETQQETYVENAQDAVDSLNQHMQDQNDQYNNILEGE